MCWPLAGMGRVAAPGQWGQAGFAGAPPVLKDASAALAASSMLQQGEQGRQTPLFSYKL